MTALLYGSSQTHLGTSSRRAGGHIINDRPNMGIGGITPAQKLKMTA
ncbi:MAG: hypothetical protein ABIV25_02420 [Paracoccaceae bacterium]